MALIQRFIVLIPLLLSFITVVLLNLALLAGSQPGFMEDYAIIRFNTTVLGQNIIRDGNHNNDDLDDIANAFLAHMAENLGISDWYSIHIKNACQGEFVTNTTAFFSLNTTNCTRSSLSNQFNLTKILSQEMAVGPFALDLTNIDWPDSIQNLINNFNSALLALYIIFILGICFSSLSMLAGVLAFFFKDKNFVLFANIIPTSLAAIMVTLGCIVITAVSSITVNAVNRAGAKVTLAADKGIKFYIVSWTAAIFIILSTLFWMTKLAMLRKGERKGYMM
ncbi:actin cortical patch SUR7/pH-response regulator pali [Trichoderma austrokoningii]